MASSDGGARARDTGQGPVAQLVGKGRRIMLANRLAIGTLICVAGCLGMWLPLCLLDNALHLPPGLRLALSLGAITVMAWLLWHHVIHLLLRPQSLARAALTLEAAFEVPENLLINALCFEGRTFHVAEKPFARQTVKAALAQMPAADLGELWDKRRITRWAIPILLILLLWSIYAIAFGRQAANALSRYLRPLGDTPPAGSITLEMTPDQNVTLSEGDNLDVTVRIGGQLETLRSYPQIFWRDDGATIDPEQPKGEKVTLRAAGSESHEFHHTFEKVNRSFMFRVFAGDTYSANVQVTVNRIPRIAESHFRVAAPAYTGLAVVDSMGPPEPLSGLRDSETLVTVRLDKEAERLRWRTPQETIDFEPIGGQWQAKTRLRQPGTYEIDVGVSEASKDVTIASGAILLRQDGVPQVEFETESNRLLVDPGQRLQLPIRASDDFGIRHLQVTLRQSQADSNSVVLQEWTYEGPPGKKTSLTETLLLTIDSARFQPGNSYVLEASGQDFCPQGNTGRSQPLTLQVKGLEEMKVAADAPSAGAFEALNKAIQAQQTALGNTRNLMTNLDDVLVAGRKAAENAAALGRHRDELGKRQGRVGECMTEAWNVSTEPRPAFVQKLVALRDSEHRQTMEKIAAVAGTDLKPEAVQRSLGSVERLQAYILDQLIALKGDFTRQQQVEAQKAAEEVLGQPQDLGPDPDEALEAFKNELESFVDEQKRIMHDRQMIADLPPEDFSDEHKDQLEALALDQSKLSEILDKAVNDFTNLDLQDFGDNTIVEKTKSVFEKAEELAKTAAEAAEMRQARQDAYRLETEAVEMAEELMINCEATMGFYDNIQFVAEIPEDEQLVAPLADLPAELEDLVGDLITSEEEMRPEVEDIGSYLNSLDHTAGPIADGTISSTSAKGKTGDQKPEDNIIQGRSGAGRTGMSDGQLVESVAKALSDNEYGLRERTSNTPLESGQVKDEDTKAQTGGTGLGKTTDGTTLFGVGGRLPAKVLEMMKETAATQMEIRRSAQEIAPKLKTHNLPTAELDKSISAMRRVEEALAQRDGVGIREAYAATLDSLSRSRSALGRQVVAQRTQDAALARRLDEMQSQGTAGRFKGYEQIISAYFEALARQDAGREGNTP
ncbi:MAG: hypothetical protein MUC88_12675 [Planctomycetes bacterium]|nr:hypothetical protein [Planctomycetota bacterium]